MIAQRDGYEISTDQDRLDLDAVHAYLTTSYWSPGVPRDRVERAARGSLAFGLYAPAGAQVGYARVVGDGASFAWIADVYVLEGHRGRGLAVWLMETLLSHPELRDQRRIMLATKDAHGLYERFGFRPLPDPERYMALRPGGD